MYCNSVNLIGSLKQNITIQLPDGRNPQHTSTVFDDNPAWSNLLEEDPLERAPEVLVEDGVDDGVEGRVGVAEPEGEGEAGALHLPAE